MCAQGFRWNPGRRAAFARHVQRSLEATAKDVLEDVGKRQVVPHASTTTHDRPGELERSGHVEAGPDAVRIVYDAPFAARVYFSPAWMRFSSDPNPSAKRMWLRDYKTGGERHAYAVKRYQQHLRRGW